jgi:3-oxoadipate enol-lactonase
MKLHHVSAGDGPTLCLVGSLGSSLAMWEPQLDALRDFRVVRVDLPGHGGSPIPDEPFAVADVGRAVLELAGEGASFCGLSLGGVVCMWIAAHARVDRVVLACTKPAFRPPEQWQERAETVRRDGLAAIVDAVMARWFTSDADPGVVAKAREMFLATPREGYARCCEALRDADLSRELARIEAPLLVVGGAEDPSVTPAEIAALPGRHEIVPGAAHLASMERPREFNALLTAFLT